MFDLICERSAPISEHGRHNVGSDGADKFELLRNLMLNYTSTTPPPEAPFVPISAYGAATLPLSVSLLDIAQQISAGALSAKQPLTLEEVCPNATILIYSFPSANFYRFVHPPDSDFPRSAERVFSCAWRAGVAIIFGFATPDCVDVHLSQAPAKDAAIGCR